MQPEDGTTSTARSPLREFRKEIRDLTRVLAEKALRELHYDWTKIGGQVAQLGSNPSRVTIHNDSDSP